MILLIETSTTVCSVAICNNEKISAIKEINSGYTHAENLTQFIDDVIKQAATNYKNFKAVAVSKGPGSYTGLRIGVSVAKGLCYALDIPLIAVNTLQAMAANFLLHNSCDDKTLLCPMVDARRMEVYCAVFNNQLKEINPTQALIVTEQSFEKELATHEIIFFGDGALKTKNLFSQSANAKFNSDIIASAKGMTKIANEKFLASDFENTAYFEPFYLKNFVPGLGSK
jgi:tRNA threonylcarbamoyladenosine biosynthesis protein TsaB